MKTAILQKQSTLAGRDLVLADHIPYSSHITNTILCTKQGEYLTVWKVGGISFEAVDVEDILARHNGFGQLMRSFSAGNVAVWSHKIRRKLSDRLNGVFDNDYSRDLNKRYFDSFAGYRMMANELYLTVIYRPQANRSGLASLFGKMARRSREQIEHERTEALREYDRIAEQVEASLKAYDVARLGVYEANSQPCIDVPAKRVLYSEALEFLGFLVNGVWEKVPLRYAGIAEYLPTVRPFFGHANVELWHPSGGRRFAAMLDFSDYPEYSEPGLLNPILYDDYEYIETQSFCVLTKYDAMSALKTQRNQLIAAEDVSQSQIEEMNSAMEGLANGHFVMGDYHFSLAILGENLAEVTKNVAKARSALQDQGFQTQLIDMVPDSAWFAQLPGNYWYRPREAKLTSRVFCGLAAMHNFASGKREGNPWGEAVTILKTPSGQPFYMNFHVSPDDEDSDDKKLPANTMIVGMTGSGKTVLELFLLSEAMKYGMTAVVFDKDQGTKIAILAMGGQYYSLRMGVPTGLAPFKKEPTAQNKLFWISLLRQLGKHPSRELTPLEEQDIQRAVETVARFPKELRSIVTICQNLTMGPEDNIRGRLLKWSSGNLLGWVVDNDEDTQDFSENRLFGYDYTEFLKEDAIRTPIMMCLLHSTEELIDGRRFCYVIAEFWKALESNVFESFAKDKQKTIRKQNGFGIFDTQSPDDALQSNIARTLIEQMATVIYLPNPKATKKDYVDGFGLTESEYRIVQALSETSRMFLIKQGHRSAIAMLDLAGFDEDLNILSGTEDNVALLDELTAEVGDDPQVWMPIFHERIAQRRALTRKRGS